MIVPRTFGSGIENLLKEEDTFDQPLLTSDNSSLSPAMLALVHDLFKTLLGPHHTTRTLSYHAFKPLYESLNPDSLSPKSPTHLSPSTFAATYPTGLTLESLKLFLYSHLTTSTTPHDAFRATLSTLGYHPGRLVPTCQRRFNLTLHSRSLDSTNQQIL